MDNRVARAGRPVQEFLTGVGLLIRGLGTYARNPGLVVLGMLPALITFALLVGAFIVLLVFLGPESRAVTWFADGWSTGVRDAVRVLADIASEGNAIGDLLRFALGPDAPALRRRLGTTWG